MRTVILCGGRGTRAWPATAELPKPMLEIGGRPVLQHVMEIYARQGFRDFVLATGYLGHVIADWAATLATGWTVTCLDTGVDADTADRLRHCAQVLGEPFLATYGDGVGDVDIAGLARRHRDQRAAATITIVPLPSPYGTVDVDEAGRVVRFVEKPRLRDHWVNAGFMALDAAAVLATTGGSLEQDVLPRLAAQGGLFVHRHEGFWRSMDTHKDVVELDSLAREERPPWLTPPT